MLHTHEQARLNIGLVGKQEKSRITKEVDDLNNTVLSKSFKAPSAWAEREVKYKAEKRDWEAQARCNSPSSCL